MTEEDDAELETIERRGLSLEGLPFLKSYRNPSDNPTTPPPTKSPENSPIRPKQEEQPAQVKAEKRKLLFVCLGLRSPVLKFSSLCFWQDRNFSYTRQRCPLTSEITHPVAPGRHDHQNSVPHVSQRPARDWTSLWVEKGELTRIRQ
jgi:hypothetical protein